MNLRVAAVLAGAALITGCATRGDVALVREDIARIGTSVSSTETRVARDVDGVRTDTRALDAKISALETKLADANAKLARLEARTDAAERARQDEADAMRRSNAVIPRAEPSTTPTPSTAPLPAAPPPPSASTPQRVSPPPSPPAPSLALPPSSASVPRASPPPPAATAPDADHAYAAALATFRAGELGQAVLDFLDFLGRYPKHHLAPNAQYWIGEAYFAQHDYRQSLVEFEKVLDYGLTNRKAPDALVKMGLCYRQLRDGTRAADMWQRVVHDYPATDAARQARGLLRGGAESTTR